MRYFLRIASVTLALCFTAALTGCGAGIPGDGPVALPALGGSVHGGQQPIVGAAVSLYAAGHTFFGGNATSLLTSGAAVTDANGNFSITGAYNLANCQSAHSQVYLVATGGNSGSGTNSAISMMAALGDCANISSSTFININEVTTVASVYALQAFMTSGSSAVAGSNTDTLGMANAFLTAANLASYPTGRALATTPGGNGLAPQAKINTVADAIATCINSASGSAACTSLFIAATPPGGTAPTDTLSATYNIAHNPQSNVQAVYNLVTPNPPFQPTLGTAPNDWTLTIQFSGGGLNQPKTPQVDANGNIWVPNTGGNSVSVFNPSGVSQYGTTGITGSGISQPSSLAIDTSNNVWITSLSSNVIVELTTAGATLSGTGGFSAASPQSPVFSQSIAIASPANTFHVFFPDFSGNNAYRIGAMQSNGNAGAIGPGIGSSPNGVVVDNNTNVTWVADTIANTIYKFNSNNMEVGTGFTGPNIHGPWGMAVLPDDTIVFPNSAAANASQAVVTQMSSSGTILNGTGTPIPAQSRSIAVDSFSSEWTANYDGSISHIANTLNGSSGGSSATTGFQSPGLTQELGVALDASGNVWTTDFANLLVEWVGIAGPVVTPIAANTFPATRP